MATPTTFRVHKGNQILPVGVPLIVTALDTTDPKYRRIEIYLFVFKLPEGVHFVKRRFQFNGIPAVIMSDEVLLSQALDIAEAKLESYLLAKRRELGPDILPYEQRFHLKLVEPESIFYYVVRRQLFDRFRAIRSETYCKELETFLNPISNLRKCSIEEFNDE